MPTLTLQCRCGNLRGTATLTAPPTGNRVVCYCRSCQAFARYLGQEDILDPQGGTDLFQLAPADLRFHQGQEHLRCLRLTPTGTYRWYAACCYTPVATSVSARLPVVGLIHNLFDADERHDSLLGPVRYRIQGRDALAQPLQPNVAPGFPLPMLLKLTGQVLLATLKQRARPSPFFDDNAQPISPPHGPDVASAWATKTDNS